MKAKTGRVASNGFRERERERKSSFFSQANNWDGYFSRVAYKRQMREVFGYI